MRTKISFVIVNCTRIFGDRGNYQITKRVPAADRGGEEINIGFSDFGAGSSNQLRDPRARRSAGNDRKFSLGNQFQTDPLKDVMFYATDRERSNSYPL